MEQYLDLPFTNAQQIFDEITVGITSISSKVLSADPSRIFVRFMADTNNVWLGDSGVSANNRARIFVGNLDQFVELHYRNSGIEVQQEWWAVRAAGVSQLSIMTVRWQPVPHLG